MLKMSYSLMVSLPSESSHARRTLPSVPQQVILAIPLQQSRKIQDDPGSQDHRPFYVQAKGLGVRIFVIPLTQRLYVVRR